MRKFTLLLTALLLMAMATVAYAYDEKSKPIDGEKMVELTSLAIAPPWYSPKATTTMTNTELISLLDAGRVASKRTVVAYAQMTDNIFHDTHVDLRDLDRRLATQCFNEHVAKYAQSYVLLTVANDNRLTFFFDVYDTATGKQIYAYEFKAEKNDPENAETFTEAIDKFYKNYDWATNDERKKLDKGKKEKRKK